MSTSDEHVVLADLDTEYILVCMVRPIYEVALGWCIELTLLVLAPVAYCMVRIVD